jgi:hypothetical protein
MATVDSDKVVCGGIHAMIVAVLVLLDLSHYNVGAIPLDA